MKYQKISTIVINNVLAFIRPFASKRLSKAVELLLKPCCLVEITDTDACSGGTRDTTFTISPAQPLLGIGFAQVFSTVDDFVGTGTISTDGTTVTVEDATISAGSATFSITLFLPTNQSNSVKGVYQIATGTFTVAAC